MNFRYEKQKQKQGFTRIIGCDEVGRGSLAGPVVACAVVFDYLKIQNSKFKIGEIKDSKLLSSEKREKLSKVIKVSALWSIGIVPQNIIDKINIHNATLLAMRKAVEGLFFSVIPSGRIRAEEPLTHQHLRDFSTRGLGRDDKMRTLLCIDGQFTIPGLDVPQEAIIGGDNKVLSIAAASIVAKVHRDNLMRNIHAQYPIYNFFQHKGYGTLFHRQMIIEHGLSPLHRLSFCQNLAI